MDTKRIVEINGVKIEVDLREATAVETLRVGDAVRVLVKQYGGNYTAHDGVVIGFDQFKNLPTVTVAYAVIDYSSADVKVFHYNDATKDTEIIKADEGSRTAFSMDDATEALDKKVATVEAELKSAREKRDYFIEHIGRAWETANKG